MLVCIPFFCNNFLFVNFIFVFTPISSNHFLMFWVLSFLSLFCIYFILFSFISAHLPFSLLLFIFRGVFPYFNFAYMLFSVSPYSFYVFSLKNRIIFYRSIVIVCSFFFASFTVRIIIIMFHLFITPYPKFTLWFVFVTF